ncbi:MAG: hypothetical protein E7017_06425 [Alphaproteobacteria bacterium]|nr:hypothetical protein [Alphaproteobacteria bacterium]
MKTFQIFAMFAMLVMLASCADKKKEEPVVTPAPPPVEVYQPKHQTTAIDLNTVKKYEYFNSPTSAPATSVEVKYNATPYTEPIVVRYTYSNGDTYTYEIPKNFGIWKNEAGKLRVVKDADCTVWIQGQTKQGKFHELTFYGNPKYNGTKIKPNSYRNLPAGEIKYSK